MAGLSGTFVIDGPRCFPPAGLRHVTTRLRRRGHGYVSGDNPRAGHRAGTTMPSVMGVAMRSKLGDILDDLGLEADINDGDLVSGAVAVLSVLVDGDNNPRLMISSSEGLGWIQQAGMLRLAERICSDPPEEGDDG